MNVIDTLELMKKYSTCEQCGSDKLGDGEGTLEIDDNVFKRTCKCGWGVDKSKKIKIIASASMGKLQIFECREYEGTKAVDSKYINVALLKDKGIIKTINQTKKAEEFLNTKEGMQFYKEN